MVPSVSSSPPDGMVWVPVPSRSAQSLAVTPSLSRMTVPPHVLDPCTVSSAYSSYGNGASVPPSTRIVCPATMLPDTVLLVDWKSHRPGPDPVKLSADPTRWIAVPVTAVASWLTIPPVTSKLPLLVIVPPSSARVAVSAPAPSTSK